MAKTFFTYPPSCIISLPETCVLNWTFSVYCAGHVRLFSSPTRLSLANNCQLELFCLITIFL